MKYLKRYQLISEYPNSPKLGTIIEECYSVPYQFVDNQCPKRKCYHPTNNENWKRIKDKQVIIYN